LAEVSFHGRYWHNFWTTVV